jgi:hypothetical protein
MKITEHQLRRLIREAVQNHIDGHPFPGTLEDLAKCHAGAWGHGTVVDPSKWKESVELGGLYTTGYAPTPLRGKRKGLTELFEPEYDPERLALEDVESALRDTMATYIEVVGRDGKDISPALDKLSASVADWVEGERLLLKAYDW